MQYVLLSEKFGGLNTYLAGDKVGPGGATTSIGVDISSGALMPRFDDVIPTLDVNNVWVDTSTYVPASSQTIVPWKVGALGMTGRYAVAGFGGRLYRSHKGQGPFPSDLDGIQYTSDTADNPTWDYFGLMTPPALGTVTDSTPSAGAGVPPGTIVYYCTFYNALNQESPPSTSTEKTITVAKKLTVTLPQAYTTATTNGTATITVASSSSLRLGMRLRAVSGVIAADSYIIGISGTSVTLSKTTLSSASGVKIIDAQIVGTRLYRVGGAIETPLWVADNSITTASYADEKLDKDLGYEIETIGTTDIPSGLSDIAISPSGIMLATKSGSAVAYFSINSPSIYDATKTIVVSNPPLTTIYALDRFICPTIRGAFTVTIDDAVLGIPVVQTIDDTEPCQVSYYVYATDVGGAVWWNTNKGIVQTNGSTIETVTRFTFAKDTALNFRDCYGAEFYNNDYYAILETSSSTAALFKYNNETGWTQLKTGFSTTSPGAIGYHINDGCIIFTGADSPVKVRKLEASSSRLSSALYRTGEWTGEKFSSLKKFRKISAVYKGNIQIQAIIDGTTWATVSQDNGSSTKRVSWWLPSGAKGRSILLDISLNSSAAEVEELGIWVGEQREPMP